MSFVSRMVVLLWFTTTPLAAAAERFELTPFWGFTTLDSHATRDPGRGGLPFDDRFEGGFQLGARFGVLFGDRIALEAEYRYGPNGKFIVHFDDPILGAINLEVPIDVGSHAVTGGFLYDVMKSKRWRPFVAATIGFQHFRTGEGETTLRAGFGGGVRFSMRQGIGVRVDARYVLWPSFFLTDEVEGAVEIDVGLAFGF